MLGAPSLPRLHRSTMRPSIVFFHLLRRPHGRGTHEERAPRWRALIRATFAMTGSSLGEVVGKTWGKLGQGALEPNRFRVTFAPRMDVDGPIAEGSGFPLKA